MLPRSVSLMRAPRAPAGRTMRPFAADLLFPKLRSATKYVQARGNQPLFDFNQLFIEPHNARIALSCGFFGIHCESLRDPVHLFSIRNLLTENRAAGKTPKVKKTQAPLDHIKMQPLGTSQGLTTYHHAQSPQGVILS